MPAHGPIVSVVVPAYNSELTLLETLCSIQEQASVDFEAVVVDDGSTDCTMSIARQFAEGDSRFTVLTQRNTGPGAARNLGAAASSAEWILPVDADDVLLPSALGQMMEFVSRHPGFDVYSCRYQLLSENCVKEPPIGPTESTSYGLEQMIESNRLIVSTLVSRKMFQLVGGFKQVELEDYDFWLRVFAAGAKHIHNPDVLISYRVSSSSRNADPTARMRGTAGALRRLSATPGLSPAARRRARRVADFYEVLPCRIALEDRLSAGDYREAVSQYLRARRAYWSAAKWLLGLPVIAFAPRVFSRIGPKAPRQSTNA